MLDDFFVREWSEPKYKNTPTNLFGLVRYILVILFSSLGSNNTYEYIYIRYHKPVNVFTSQLEDYVTSLALSLASTLIIT